MIISAGFGLPPADYVTLLVRHVQYHLHYDNLRYIVYVEVGSGFIAYDPRVQELLRSDRLKLVIWEEFPHYFKHGITGRSSYASQVGVHSRGYTPVLFAPSSFIDVLQILVYNHAIASLFPENSVVAIADVDEFLVTANKRSSTPAASLRVPCRAGFCTQCGDVALGTNVDDRALLDLERVHAVERALWLNVSGYHGGPGNTSKPWPSHPLAWYGITYAEKTLKSISSTRDIALVTPRQAYTPSGTGAHLASSTCAFWVHLRCQVNFRKVHVMNLSDRQILEEPFTWVLDSFS
ncbi:hypothetical protein TSOC_011891 [Tetrabaena socialis]|uniref:Glycosyltransferase family 92 protein n=1 Tax=Tetrabaena socialis TaxID=47790 RepID=A0A2J7ZPG6_9CHLO|nr:hypothetical protein TSOC_011891 [Tetrabaena socialis]|eukprot:PNH02159.1 hypothetical protein TSOC_011891 [Tetrabaena socialis]